MARIKINDLPRDMKISKEEMKKIAGGAMPAVTKSGGICLGFPDVCLTPAPPPPSGMDPIPYPNIAPSGDITKDPVATKITTATKPSD